MNNKLPRTVARSLPDVSARSLLLPLFLFILCCFLTTLTPESAKNYDSECTVNITRK